MMFCDGSKDQPLSCHHFFFVKTNETAEPKQAVPQDSTCVSQQGRQIGAIFEYPEQGTFQGRQCVKLLTNNSGLHSLAE